MNKQRQASIDDNTIETQDQIEERERAKAIFDDLDKKQLDFLDEAGKSIIERAATLLAVLFVVIAFGNNFPPAYLKGNMLDKDLVILILCCYLVAIGMGMRAIQPRNYHRYRYEPQKLPAELEHMINHKKRWVQWAGALFALGTLTLAVLIVSIIWSV